MRHSNESSALGEHGCDGCPAAAASRRAFLRDMALGVAALLVADAATSPVFALAESVREIQPATAAGVNTTRGARRAISTDTASAATDRRSPSISTPYTAPTMIQTRGAERCSSWRDPVNFIPAVPAAWSVTTIAFMAPSTIGPSSALVVARAEYQRRNVILPISDMKQADITTVHANRATERRTKLRLRELCDEVLASYHQARGHDLFSSDDRNTARELMASVVKSR